MKLSVLAGHCVRQRLPTPEAMRDAVTAGVDRRNTAIRRIDWQFTTADARIKLRHLSPAFDV